jgi:hypothetical protein
MLREYFAKYQESRLPSHGHPPNVESEMEFWPEKKENKQRGKGKDEMKSRKERKAWR